VLVAISARSIAYVDDTITIPQFRALVILSARGSINVKTLARLLHVERSTTGRVVERLITAPGLASRTGRRVDAARAGDRPCDAAGVASPTFRS
jgi:DNA-binding MarR family transcriptional regulator